MRRNGAGNEIRTRDPDLGKVVLYQLSYSRVLEISIMISLALFWQSALATFAATLFPLLTLLKRGAYSNA